MPVRAALVGVGGSDPLARRPDAPGAELRLGRAVERGMVRHDHVGVLRDEEVAVERHAPADERLHLLDERARVHAAAADATYQLLTMGYAFVRTESVGVS